MKEEILNYMYELIDLIKKQDERIIDEFSTSIESDLELSEEDYQKRRKKAEELVAKIK